jgi:hypothetical protein
VRPSIGTYQSNIPVGHYQAVGTIVQQPSLLAWWLTVMPRKEVTVETAVAMLALLVALVVAVTRR